MLYEPSRWRDASRGAWHAVAAVPHLASEWWLLSVSSEAPRGVDEIHGPPALLAVGVISTSAS